MFSGTLIAIALPRLLPGSTRDRFCDGILQEFLYLLLLQAGSSWPMRYCYLHQASLVLDHSLAHYQMGNTPSGSSFCGRRSVDPPGVSDMLDFWRGNEMLNNVALWLFCYHGANC